MHVELITRAGCHLCEEAVAALEAAGRRPDAVRDVDADPELFRLYDFRVPVVIVDGKVVAEGRVSKERLRQVLSKG